MTTHTVQSKTDSNEYTVESWKSHVQQVIDKEGRPIESADDPRFQALGTATGRSYAYSLEHGEFARMGIDYVAATARFPAAPIAAPGWSTGVQSVGDVARSYIDIEYVSESIVAGEATGQISQGHMFEFDGADNEEREPYIRVRLAGDGDIGAPLSAMKDLAQVLQLLIERAEAA